MYRRLVCQFAVAVLLLTGQVLPVLAQEPLAAYPLLPTGYSSIKVFDNQSRFVGRILPEKRYWVTIDRIPLFLQKAVVAVEDSRFYEHGGVDLRGIARAAVRNVVKGRLAEGGSTITQQLIKNKYLSSEKTLDRKVNEGLMALEFEKRYSKHQILEMYLNEIYFGNGAWGIAQAARIYFDKSPEELTDAECSLLAGVPKNPGRYNPLGKPADVSTRRTVVLKRMLELGQLSSHQQKQLAVQPVAAVPPNQALYYLAHIRSKLIERYGTGITENGGLEVTAAMDLELQKQAEKTLREGVARISPQLQGALVSLDPATGDLLAIVGGVDYVKGPYNRALHARRQPGSAIKPLIYAAALENGITAASLWLDAPVSYKQGGEAWQPQNYDGRHYGEMSLRQALFSSNNVIAVKLLETLGIPAFAAVAERLGLPLRNRTDLSVALGTEEVTLHDLVAAYAPLAHDGLRPEPRSMLRVYDSYRRSWSDNPPAVSQAISAATSFVTTSMLQDVLSRGTAKGLQRFAQERPSAGKTGTTSDYRDAWFIGYTPQMVTGVWVGYDQPRPGPRSFTGGAVAAPIWERFMRQALASRPVAGFKQPETVVTISVDPTTGYPAAPSCLNRQDELFIAGTEPKEYCPKHGGGAVMPRESSLPKEAVFGRTAD